MPLLKVFHIPRSRSLRVIWLLEEIGQPYRLCPLSFPPAADYLEIVPGGSVPAIEDDGVVMCESIAILQYLTGSAGNGLGLPAGADRQATADFLQFLHYGEATLSAPLSAMLRTRFLAPEGGRTNFTTGDQKAQWLKRIGLVNAALEDGRAFVLGERFAIPDIFIGYALYLARVLGLDPDLPAHVASYQNRLLGRTAFTRALAA